MPRNNPSLTGVFPPDNFLDQLVAWGRTAPDDIFAPNSQTDIYSNVFGVLGPWEDLRHRRAVMWEVMRVLAGFDLLGLGTGVDVTNPDFDDTGHD